MAQGTTPCPSGIATKKTKAPRMGAIQRGMLMVIGFTRIAPFVPLAPGGKIEVSTGTQRGPPMRNMRVETNHATRPATTAAAATAVVLYSVES